MTLINQCTKDKKLIRGRILLAGVLLLCILFLPMQVMAASLNKTELTLQVDTSYTLKLSGNNKDTIWKSSDSKIISVKKLSQNQARVVAKKKGKAVVAVKTADETVLKCNIIVNDPIKIKSSAARLKAGEKKSLSVTGTKTTVSFSSSNSKVATVSRTSKNTASVKAKKKGSAYIIAKINGRSYRYKVTVSPPDPKIRLAVVGRGGDLSNARNAFTSAGAQCVTVTRKSISVNSYDGLVISGGADVNPSRYGAKNTASVGIDNSLDSLELSLIDKFVKAGKPIFGICRGHQIINVYFGGTLKQNIRHHRGVTHATKITTGSWLYGIYGSTESVVSWHHQAVGKLGKGLKVIQTSSDGIVEGMYHETLPIYTVQWHPELMGSKGRKTLKDFINVCRKYRK